MTIIAHTATGYLIEVAPDEIAAITGNPRDDSHHSNSRYGNPQTRNHQIGAQFRVSPAWKHLQKINESAAARASIAERLRAAATLVEHTPVVMEIPTETAAEQAAS